MEDPRVCSGVIDGVFTYLQMTLVILYPLGWSFAVVIIVALVHGIAHPLRLIHRWFR